MIYEFGRWLAMITGWPAYAILFKKKVYYEDKVKINPSVMSALREADLIILSMGSLYTSIIPNLLCEEMILRRNVIL